ncbi:MAG: isoprenylcysteine carboxylmethyltransferase family protein [Pseudomonadota bacterium]
MAPLLVGALSALALVAAGGLLALCALSWRKTALAFWPPARPDDRRARLFLSLYRVMIAVCLAASLVASVSEPVALWRILIGCTIVAIGFGAGAAIISGMGWRGALGAADGLRTDGAFAISRNPTYLAHWFGLAGWAFAVPSWPIVMALALWAASYALMAWLEEPWLAARYGEAYRAYCAKVPRFF